MDVNKKVYFAGSIRGGRQDEQLYRDIIDYIKSKGHRVLTEHVGDLSLNAKEGSGSRERDIYLEDTAWLRECDLLIAECTTPSLGVGYELAYGEKLGKPCYVFYRKSVSSLSAMIKGDDYYTVFDYETLEEILPVIDKILEKEQ